MGHTNKQSHPSLSLLRKAGMCCLWAVVAVVLLFATAVALLYVPPVQRWAVDKACETLSEEMGMDVKVENVRLSFPLDLAMGGMTAVQDGDTLVSADRLTVSVRLLPLLHGEAEVDGVSLLDTRLNTKQLIEACEIRGRVGEISLDSHSTDLTTQFAVINKVLVSDADLCIVLNDSVPEDTTESEPLLWKVKIEDLRLKNAMVKITPPLPSPQGEGAEKLPVDSTSIDKCNFKTPSPCGEGWGGVFIANAQAKAFLDLGKGEYNADLNAHDIDLVALDFAAPRINELTANVRMDSLSLNVPSIRLKTDASSLAMSCQMDMSAFDDINPGKLKAMVEGEIGKADMIRFARFGGESTNDLCDALNDALPLLPTKLFVKVDGNLNELNVSNVRIDVPGQLLLDGDATVWDAASNLSLRTNLTAKLANDGQVKAMANYAMAGDTYRANIDFSNILVNNYVDVGERTLLNGAVSAYGHGFDFQSDSTECTAHINLDDAHYGTINLSAIDADATLRSGVVDLKMSCDNDQLATDFEFNGELNSRHIAGILDIALPHLDAQAMGFSDERLKVSTTGKFDIDYDLNNLFSIEANVDALQLLIGADSIVTEPFYMMAEALKDSTSLCLKSGDLDLDFLAPCNLFQLPPRLQRLAAAVQKQQKEEEIDINVLKTYLPELHLNAVAGRNNPVSQLLGRYGYSFRRLVANIDTSPRQGVGGNVNVYRFATDSLTIDSTYITVTQDSSLLRYQAGVASREQASLPAFRAMLSGYLGMKVADAHLTYYNKQGERGIDLGMHVVGTDSCHHAKLYPLQPIIGFQAFEMNGDNYICRPRGGKPIIADVRLQAVNDSANVTLLANANEHGQQAAQAIFNNLDLSKILTVVPVPNLPAMAGLIDGNADYAAVDGSSQVQGRVRVRKFVYEGMDVGQIGGRFYYAPESETTHRIKTSWACNGIQVTDIQGVYNTAGNGMLNVNVDITDVPLSMVSPFIPDRIVQLTGSLNGNVNVVGPTDALTFNGHLAPKDVHVLSDSYSVDLTLANDVIRFNNSHLTFDQYKIYGYDNNPLALNGYVDFANLEKIRTSLNLTANNFKLIESKRAPKKIVFGDAYGDINARINGTLNDLSIRGRVRVLKSSNMTYILAETPLSQGDRLDDIVTFVDFKAPVDTTAVEEKKTFMGIDMNMNLVVEDGAKVRAEISADRQSYVDVQGGGTIRMTLTPEGVMSMMGRYTINEGEMKYTLPVIPLRTFTIHNGSYVEFTGDPMNPLLNITATERTRAAVSESDGSSRSVTFDAGLRISNTLQNMGLEFIIDAPDDATIQSELATLSAEDRNKLSVAMLATNMYLASNNSSNFTASNALNSFLQNEINNIAGKAFSTVVNVDVGMEQTTRDNGTTRTDYSFKFSRRFFSDKLNVVIGGKVNADGNREQGESNAYIDDISLEWRLDDGGTQYVRLFHEKDYTNLIEGELDKNGAGLLLRRKVEKLSDLFFWRKKEEKEKK